MKEEIIEKKSETKRKKKGTKTQTRETRRSKTRTQGKISSQNLSTLIEKVGIGSIFICILLYIVMFEVKLNYSK